MTLILNRSQSLTLAANDENNWDLKKMKKWRVKKSFEKSEGSKKLKNIQASILHKKTHV